MNRIAVYGSLRKGEYNFNRFVDYFKGGLAYVSTTVTKGFDLYDLGSYPGIVKSDNPEKELVVDIMECSEACFNMIEGMERGAGYDSSSIEIDGLPCTIYVYKGRPTKLVESGDWCKYLNHEQETEV